MESHSAKCPKVQIACPNTKVGCTIVCLREYMLHFEGVIQFHLDKAIMALQQPNGVVVRLLEFSKRQKIEEICYSLGFNTHPRSV